MRAKSAIVASLRSGDWITEERIRVYSAILVVLWVAAMAIFWTTGDGLKDLRGEPIGTDFINPYAAGRLALAGEPEKAYDWQRHYAEEAAVLGGSAQSYYSWHYPPIFLLLAAGLALLPYLPALLVWLAATLALNLAAIRAILPHPLALAAAAAAPTTLITIGHGQNAFLTAGLLGLGLAFLERRPWVAGILLGCLSYKPHLGLVLPLVLAAGGHWRAFAGAAIAVVALCGASLAAFGLAPWEAFFDSEAVIRQIVLEDVATGWFRIQSLFAAVRGFGGPIPAAYAAQGALTLSVLAALAWLWWKPRGPSAKAALAAGTLLATPYVLDYDMAVIVPGIAFFVADGLRTGFRPYEKTLLVAIGAAPLFARLAAQNLNLPLGLAAAAALFILAMLRAATPPSAFPAPGEAESASQATTR